MQSITTIGFDIAKSVFQVHGVDAGGQVLIRRQLKRRQVLAFADSEAFVFRVQAPKSFLTRLIAGCSGFCGGFLKNLTKPAADCRARKADEATGPQSVNVSLTKAPQSALQATVTGDSAVAEKNPAV
jgi:hypothetical protein